MNPPKQSTVEWVRCYYDAFNRRDWEWIAAMLAPDVEWFLAARAARMRGIPAVVAGFRSLLVGVPGAQIEARAVHDAGLIVIAECGIRHNVRKSVPPLSRIRARVLGDYVISTRGERASLRLEALRARYDIRIVGTGRAP